MRPEKTDDSPKIGVAVLVRKAGKILFGKRIYEHGEKTWAPPGGHLEYHENPADCAKREVLEETGLKIKNTQFATITNDIFEDTGKHYITLYYIADYDSGDVENKAPYKCERWKWFEWNKLPKPLFLCIQNLLKQNFNPFKPV